MKLRISMLSALAGALFVAAPSHAVIVQSTSAAAAGITGDTTYAFSELGLANNTTVTNQYVGVSFATLVQTPQTCDGFVAGISGGCLGNFGPSGTVDPWSMTFDVVQSQVGFNFITNPGTSTFQAFLGAALVDSGSFATDYVSANNYFGFSGVLFDRIVVDAGGDNSAMLMDNLTFRRVAVPEPAGLALLGLSLLGFVASRRSRK